MDGPTDLAYRIEGGLKCQFSLADRFDDTGLALFHDDPSCGIHRKDNRRKNFLNFDYGAAALCFCEPAVERIPYSADENV